MNKIPMKLLCCLMALALILTGCSRSNSVSSEDGTKKSDTETSKPTSLMWEVTDKEGHRLYLLGSIHAAKDDLYPLNDVITKAFNDSSVLAVECDTTTLLQNPNYLDIMGKLMYTDGSTLEDHISKDLYEKTEKLLKDQGMAIDQYKQFKPFMFSSLILQLKLAEWGYNADDGIDVHLIREAKDKEKDIVEIESVEYQFGLLGGFSDEIQELELESAVEGLESSKQYMDDMFDYWLSGDVAGMEKLLLAEDDALTQEEKEVYQEFEKVMFDDRNNNMTLKAEEYIKTGKVYFFVVGSAHMIGDTGIVKQLRDKGYQVVQK